MGEKYQKYHAASYRLPEKSFAWNLYGAGMESMGRDGKPEPFAIPEPTDDQLLVRIDTVSICFSDVKILKQCGSHPKLYNRNLAVDPTRLGHEVALTIIKVGKNLANDYKPGQRLALQPDIYKKGMSTAYGYTIPGGLVQYHCIGREVLETAAPRQRPAPAPAPGPLYIDAETLRCANLRILTRLIRGEPAGPEGSAAKLFFSETWQRLTELALEMLGPHAVLWAGSDWAVADGRWQYRALRARGNTIQGGTSEIMRNVFAERLLGLPKD